MHVVALEDEGAIASRDGDGDGPEGHTGPGDRILITVYFDGLSIDWRCAREGDQVIGNRNDARPVYREGSRILIGQLCKNTDASGVDVNHDRIRRRDRGQPAPLKRFEFGIQDGIELWIGHMDGGQFLEGTPVRSE